MHELLTYHESLATGYRVSSNRERAHFGVNENATATNIAHSDWVNREKLGG